LGERERERRLYHNAVVVASRILQSVQVQAREWIKNDSFADALSFKA